MNKTPKEKPCRLYLRVSPTEKKKITNIAKLAAEKIIKKDVMVLGPGIKTGLNICCVSSMQEVLEHALV